MLTLSLLRHAKSSWADPGQQDFDRPLNARGESTAPRMGAHMAEHAIAPQLVLCSPAVRACQTLELVLPHLTGEPTVLYEDAFYLAAPTVLLQRLRQVDAGVSHVMLVGHDPGLHGLALELAGSGDADALESLARKFPTAGLAVIAFNARAWTGVRRAAGRLTHFITPKMLA